MLKNPATGKKVKITGKIGQKLVKDFLEGRITLDKEDVKMIREGEKVAKQALKAQKKIEKEMGHKITASLKGVGSKISFMKVANFLAKEKAQNLKQGYCSTSTIIAHKILAECKKSRVRFTEAEKEEFVSFFKEALKKGDVQLGGGHWKCENTASVVFGTLMVFTGVLAPIGLLVICGVVLRYVREKKEEH